ncbi:MAG: ABC transporter transmembrane domain-containing protein [Pseudomonadota bacterium]
MRRHRCPDEKAQGVPREKAALTKKQSVSPLKQLVPYLTRYKLLAAGSLVALTIAAATTLALPIAVRRMIDFGFSSDNAELINTYFTALIAVSALLALASALRFYLVVSFGERIVADLRRDVFSHIMSLSASFYDRTRSGEIVSRMTADTTQIKSAFSSTFSYALRNMILGIGGFVMMLISAPRLAAITIVAIPLIIAPIVLFGRSVRRRSRAAQDTLADASAFATEAITSVRSFQAFAAEGEASKQFSTSVGQAFMAARSAINARAWLTGLGIFLVFTSIVAVLWLGARSVFNGTMTTGELSQFVLYAIITAAAFAALSETWGELQQTAGAAERLSELLSEKTDVKEAADAVTLPANIRGDVEFKDVKFAYPTRPDEQILRGLSLNIKAGETIAVVGSSGAGKSTLFALLLRFYDPASGAIRIDGTNIDKATLRSLRSTIANVPQDIAVLSGTVAENIAFAAPDISREAIIEAAKTAHADRFIQALPNGYDTEVGERGITLSGGQRQRIAIARAVLADAPILLLDEATSALDAESEDLVQKALDKLMNGRTTIVIAHRLATILKADRIVVMDNGQIVEEGTHATLSRKKNGLYANLAKLQFDLGQTSLSAAE